ncbi:Tetratricopeptide repeat protein [Candidatus Bilamarchaeum dharawalense]|uniref:Tetratricopeptide repeat protein n=1 Tax=Candidatus Bilamarchaeum dharawalense TaxID=2885759 RepID=A0A5E4LNB0_9ARCH|nr:Tetratricopeptide repeat protein [Candidatus Bilamarchaeum dharawalense]
MRAERMLFALKEVPKGAIIRLEMKYDSKLTAPLVERHIREEPNDPGGYWGLAYITKGAALARVEEAIARLGEDPILLYALGYAKMSLQDDSGAFEAFRKAVDLNPVDFETLSNCATALNHLERFHEAKDYWKQAIELDPERHGIWFGLGKSEYYLGQYERALRHITSALILLEQEEGDTRHAKACYLGARARTYFKLEKFDEAIADLENAAKSDRSEAVKVMKSIVDGYKKQAGTRKIGRTLLRITEKMIEVDPSAGGDHSWYLVRDRLREQYGTGTVETIVRIEPKIGRNEPCPCGSGRKYKKCCGSNG